MIKRDYLFNELFENNANNFTSHLLVEGNERIIFSGRFGTGKTTFLNEFFLEENQELHFKGIRYNAIKVYPVNYSIASNEDIFEYIKYDVLIEILLNNKFSFEHIDLSYWQNISFEIKNHPERLASLLFTMIPKLGKQMDDVLTKVVDLKKQMESSLKKNKIKLSEQLQTREFLSEFTEMVGGLYESNAITNLIKTILQRAKSEKEENGIVENVLIIDDLDRIDPEHIFRILNVFAAHFDNKSNLPNKFGFDKVILVCDINNIREIFSTKYGIKTDFNGYIDKFYSARIFEYSIRSVFARIAHRIIYDANWSDTEFRHSQRGAYDTLKNAAPVAHDVVRSVMEMLVVNDQLDIRNIKKYTKIPLLTPDSIKFKGTYVSLHEHITLLRLYQLSFVLGNFGRLKEAISNCTKPFYVRDGFYYQVRLMLIELNQLPYNGIQDFEIPYNVDGRELYLTCKDGKYDLTDKIQTALQLSQNEFKSVLIDVIEFLSHAEIYHH